MPNRAALLRDLEALSNDWDASIELLNFPFGDVGLEDGTTAPKSARSGHDPLAHIMRVRSILFQVLGSNVQRRLQFEHYHTEWPITPQNACNMGFLLTGDGYGIGYHSFDDPCGCIDGYHEEPDGFTALMLAPDGRYRPVLGRPIFTSHGAPVRFKQSNGILLKLDIPDGWDVAPMPVARSVRQKDVLYAIGTNQQHWVIQQGNLISGKDDPEDLTTTLECYHGFCGAPLFNQDGLLVGFGASIAYEGYDDDGVPIRAYGSSRFVRLADLLDSRPEGMPEDFRVSVI